MKDEKVALDFSCKKFSNLTHNILFHYLKLHKIVCGSPGQFYVNNPGLIQLLNYAADELLSQRIAE
jgi:hypothetical protein